jgi:transposase
LQVIALLEGRMPIREVAARTGYSLRTVSYIAQRYRAHGLAGLADRREQGAGAPPLLSLELQRELGQALQQPPPQGEPWTGPMVAQWIAARIGRAVHRQRGWEYLRRLGVDSTAAPTAHDDQSVDQ